MPGPVNVNAFLLCDSATRDERGKWMVFGVFDTVWAKAFPAIHLAMTVYFRLVIP